MYTLRRLHKFFTSRFPNQPIQLNSHNTTGYSIYIYTYINIYNDKRVINVSVTNLLQAKYLYMSVIVKKYIFENHIMSPQDISGTFLTYTLTSLCAAGHWWQTKNSQWFDVEVKVKRRQ